MKMLAVIVVALLVAVGCSSGDSVDGGEAAVIEPGSQDGAGVRLVAPEQAAQIQADPPEDLIVLDVRTAEEFAAGHLEGAMTIDFYDDDFADRLAELDPDQPYLLYCQSGNRSGQTATIMEQLGFTDVAEIDGGIAAWGEANLPLTN